MRKYLEEGKGVTLIEIIVGMFIFSIVIFSAILVFKEYLYKFKKISGEKKVYYEPIEVFNYIEKYITAAMCNDKEGLQKINFIGEKTIIKFVSPFSEDKESDLAKFTFYIKDDRVRVSIVRVNMDNPNFDFPSNFSGAQILGENISIFEIEYFDGCKWISSWNTEKMEEPLLPQAVKIFITSYSEKIEGKRIEKKITKIINIDW